MKYNITSSNIKVITNSTNDSIEITMLANGIPECCVPGEQGLFPVILFSAM
jgi:hypothetical protein